MAHEIDTTTGTAAIAYAGHTPWHGLGSKVDGSADLDTWQREAGLNWWAERARVTFTDSAGETRPVNDRDVLYRSDTKAPLSVVSSEYQVVQPSDVVDLFRSVCEAGGFEMETLGALRGGKRLWGLAKVNDGAAIARRGKTKDVVKPYLLMATSFDGSLPTIGDFTAIRVVCANTLRMSVGETGNRASVRLPHSAKFDREQFRLRLGVVKNAWERFQVEAGTLAETSVTDAEAEAFFVELLRPHVRPDAEGKAKDPRDTRGFKTLYEMFTSRNFLGAETAAGTKWGLLNVVTEHVDHVSGRGEDSRLNSAWFGAGGELKDRARALLVAA